MKSPDYSDNNRFHYGYKHKGGWDIDTSDRTQRESDGGHIPGRYQWEETVDVSADKNGVKDGDKGKDK